MVTDTETIASVEDLAAMLGVTPSGCTTATKSRIADLLYRYTNVRISFEPGGIRIYSILEECGLSTEVYVLRYPFDEEKFDAHIDAIEEQTARMWDALSVVGRFT